MKTLSAALIITFLFLTFAHSASALSCMPAYPKVGVVAEFSPQLSATNTIMGYTIVLDDARTFDTVAAQKDELYSIDAYESVLTQYLTDAQSFKPLVGDVITDENAIIEPTSDPRNVTLPANAFEKMTIERGDLFIQGPPFHICDYGFIGIASPNGELRHAFINGAFNDYIYNEALIKASPGEALECKDDFCVAQPVQVNYDVAGEKFTLSPGQSHKLNVPVFGSFTLLDASDYKKQKDGEPQIFDWGMGKYAKYIIDFSRNSATECVDASKPAEKANCQHAPIYDASDTCITKYEETCTTEDTKNIFEKFTNWLQSTFF